MILERNERSCIFCPLMKTLQPPHNPEASVVTAFVLGQAFAEAKGVPVCAKHDALLAIAVSLHNALAKETFAPEELKRGR